MKVLKISTSNRLSTGSRSGRQLGRVRIWGPGSTSPAPTSSSVLQYGVFPCSRAVLCARGSLCRFCIRGRTPGARPAPPPRIGPQPRGLAPNTGMLRRSILAVRASARSGLYAGRRGGRSALQERCVGGCRRVRACVAAGACCRCVGAWLPARPCVAAGACVRAWRFGF